MYVAVIEKAMEKETRVLRRVPRLIKRDYYREFAFFYIKEAFSLLEDG